MLQAQVRIEKEDGAFEYEDVEITGFEASIRDCQSPFGLPLWWACVCFLAVAMRRVLGETRLTTMHMRVASTARRAR